MSARTSAVLLVALLAAAACTQGAADDKSADTTEEATSATESPNVLIILTDDQPVGSMGVMPATRRWFQGRGLKFTNAYVTTPYCCPSRASILTGQYAHNHNVRWDMTRDPDGLGDQKSTVLYQLRTQAGYRTAYFGKYLNGWDLDRRPPHLDRWAIFPNSSPDGYYDAMWNVDGRKKRVATYSTEYIRRRGERFIRNNADQPWLMYLSTAAPHPPFVPEPKYADAATSGWRRWKRRNPSVESGDLSGKHPSLETKLFPLSRVREIRRMQLRTLMSVDDLVASVMRTLGREGQRRNTLVFFLSDNGFLWGEHGGLIRKMAPYTRSIKVPMMMRWPEGGIEPGTKDRRLVANIDLAASIYDAVGLEDTPRVDGHSLLDPSWDRDRLHFEYYAAHQLPTWASTLTREYQYVEWYEDEEGTAVDLREYYDLRTDPHQMENLAADPSARRSLDLQSLSAQLAADRLCSGETCP